MTLGYFVVLKSGKMLEYIPLGAIPWEESEALPRISSATATRVEEEGMEEAAAALCALVYNQ